MRSVRTRGTAPELALRSALRRRGLRFRVHYPVPGTPDVAFPDQKVALFVHGDYWHGNSWKRRGFRSIEEQFAGWKNGGWWLDKVRANAQRDRRKAQALRRAGWRVLSIWEGDIDRGLDRCIARVLRALDA